MQAAVSYEMERSARPVDVVHKSILMTLGDS